MATSNTTHRYKPHGREPTVATRCDECGRAYYDANFQTCRECGASL